LWPAARLPSDAEHLLAVERLGDERGRVVVRSPIQLTGLAERRTVASEIDEDAEQADLLLVVPGARLVGHPHDVPVVDGHVVLLRRVHRVEFSVQVRDVVQRGQRAVEEYLLDVVRVLAGVESDLTHRSPVAC
jgi:hypothetical protein